MPEIRGHEKQAAVPRVVIRVRGLRVARLHRRSVRALTAHWAIDLRMIGARPRHRRRDQHQVAAADGTLARILFVDDRVDRTAPHAFGLRLRRLRLQDVG